jgi:hypothetical protein
MLVAQPAAARKACHRATARGLLARVSDDAPPPATFVREGLACLLSVGGAALLALPARHYRLDLVTCAAWPPLSDGARYGAVYALAIAAMGLGWWLHPAQHVGRTFALGLLVHAVALLSPPSLSQDTLSYAAIGRSLAWFGGRGSVPLELVLPPGDRFLSLLPPTARGQSPYFAGFDQLARGVALVAGDRVRLALRGYQLIGFGSMVATALLAQLAMERGRRAQAVALVLLCPLGVIEATVEGHNDALLAVAMALFVALTARGALGWSLGALASGLLVKANALVPLMQRVLELVLQRVRVRPRAAWWWGGALATVAGLVLLMASARHVPTLRRFVALVGSPEAPYDYCTRSIECLPRVILRWVFGWPTAAWLIGVAFRAGGLLWLAFAAARAAATGATLRWLGTGLFVYYAFLHGWAQTWYLLPLLPLLPHADERMRPAMRLYCVTGVLYYALVLPYACRFDHATKAGSDLAEAVVTILPPSVLLLRARGRRPSAI